MSVNEFWLLEVQRGSDWGLPAISPKRVRRVAICGRKEANLVKAREQLGEVVTVAAHLGKAEDVEQLFRTVQQYLRQSGYPGQQCGDEYFYPLHR